MVDFCLKGHCDNNPVGIRNNNNNIVLKAFGLSNLSEAISASAASEKIGNFDHSPPVKVEIKEESSATASGHYEETEFKAEPLSDDDDLEDFLWQPDGHESDLIKIGQLEF